MEVKILENKKDSMVVEIDNLTLVELLRAYLNEDSSVSFAAWRRNHPTENPILSIKAKNPKKSLKDAISTAVKDLSKAEKDFIAMK
tara:strand:+ start:75 stop:332 length:258 start_codon:yes stop_codon:yes gene_type:complete